ncbi:MAG: PorP/SprF family type IX secretion system membrane protein [Bacteroidota bacterium]
MMKKWLSVLILLIIGITANAQNGFFFSHYMLNPSYFNPAWVGMEGKAFAAFQYRNQWLGYNSSFDGSGGAPSTQLLTLNIPVNGPISGIGANISNDNLGPLNNIQGQFSVSAKWRFSMGTLSVGLMPGFFSQTEKFDELRFNDPEDPLNLGSRQTQIRPDLNAGIFFVMKNNIYIGVSAMNILEPSFNFGIDIDSAAFNNQFKRNYTGLIGTAIAFNQDLVIKPSVLIRSDLIGFTYDVSAIAIFKEKMWGGLSYRRSESAILLLGYSLLEDNVLKLGYSFDYVVNEQDAKQPTSHEIYIRYDIPDLIFGGKKIVKTPRFSF